jgi:hypothetical protein
MAIYDLKLSEKFFWELTPAKLFYLKDRVEQTVKQQDARFGMIVATIRNLFRGKEDRPVGALEVMGYDDDKPEPTKDPEYIARETALRFRLLSAAMGGVKKEK